MKISKIPNRLLSLDLLRGFFIVVIIIDHLGRWPSLLEVFTGRGTLWVNAACGFVIISGLLIGYVRGYRDREKSFFETTKKLLRRALILYLWLIIGTVVYSAITWYAPHPELLAWVEIPNGEWWLLITSALSFAYTNNWVHFLSLYALFLLFSPVFIYLLRSKLVWLAIILSVGAYIIGLLSNTEWLQWQILFFIPAVAGFYLENIKKFWKHLTATKKTIISASFYATTIVTLIASFIMTKTLSETDVAIQINTTVLSINPLSVGVVILSFIWFTAFVLLFSRFEQAIDKRLGWLFYPIGTSSLTAYIIHPVTIILASLVFAGSSSIILNTVLGIVCIIGTWLLVKQPWIQKVVPR